MAFIDTLAMMASTLTRASDNKTGQGVLSRFSRSSGGSASQNLFYLYLPANTPFVQGDLLTDAASGNYYIILTTRYISGDGDFTAIALRCNQQVTIQRPVNDQTGGTQTMTSVATGVRVLIETRSGDLLIGDPGAFLQQIVTMTVQTSSGIHPMDRVIITTLTPNITLQAVMVDSASYPNVSICKLKGASP